ncbi:MAG: BrnA antitoxin family protein [Deltaproteobacteria bacterium]|jgi:hypothetical protein|nr:BrnA antitoxin family protein [Deltaproteobacteria bacterium]
MTKSEKPMEITAEEFDRRFDDGEDITPYLDFSKAGRPGRELRRVNVDFPSWMVSAMDKEASRLGISRQALIKFAMDNHLQHAKHSLA